MRVAVIMTVPMIMRMAGMVMMTVMIVATQF